MVLKCDCETRKDCVGLVRFRVSYTRTTALGKRNTKHHTCDAHLALIAARANVRTSARVTVVCPGCGKAKELSGLPGFPYCGGTKCAKEAPVAVVQAPRQFTDAEDPDGLLQDDEDQAASDAAHGRTAP